MNQTNRLIALGILGMLLLPLSCALPIPQNPDTLRKDVRISVVLTDYDTINKEARRRGYQSQAMGFFDPVRNELWCPNETSPQAFKICGHELCHAVKGFADTTCHATYGH
jgi:hypothetical protein